MAVDVTGVGSEPVDVTGVGSEPVEVTGVGSEPVEVTGVGSEPVEVTGVGGEPNMDTVCDLRYPYENYAIPCNSEHNKKLELLLNLLLETDKKEQILKKQLNQQLEKINNISKRKIQLEKKKTQEMMMDYYAIQHELIYIGWQQKHNYIF